MKECPAHDTFVQNFSDYRVECERRFTRLETIAVGGNTATLTVVIGLKVIGCPWWVDLLIGGMGIALGFCIGAIYYRWRKRYESTN